LSETEKRKIEHIDIAITKEIRGPLTTWLEHVHLIHDAVPEIDFNEIDLSIEFLGKKLKAPIIISGMTGGHKDTAKINEALAEAAEKFGIAIGVGSQRAAIENPELEYTYSIVRERAPSTVVLANIGAAQIVKGYDVDKILKAIDMLKADGIAIHLNPAQESVQPEGEPFYKGFLKRLRDIAESINKPIIIKETGTGLSRESVAKLREIGIRYFDVAGSGGTNWVLIEKYRAHRRGESIKEKIAEDLSIWGIPTAASVIETRYAAPDSFIIGSGGVETGLDVAKIIVLGADMAGIAYPILKAYFADKLDEYLNALIHELRAVLFLTGSKDLNSLIKKPIVITGSLREWMIDRGIDRSLYEHIRMLRRSFGKKDLL